MEVYVSLLRGINISGQKIIKMVDLQASYLRLGVQQAATYIQSGNVVFRGERLECVAWAARISAQLKVDFGFEIAVVVLSVEQLAAMIAAEPFSKRAGIDLAMVYYAFFAATPAVFDGAAIAAMSKNGEEVVFAENVAYLHYPNGYGRAKFSNNFLEAQLKIRATTRNWRTTTRLLEMAQAMQADAPL